MKTTPRGIPELTEKNKSNFFGKISPIQTEAGCMEWIAGKARDGYGIFMVNGIMFRSHRVAYFLATGNSPQNLNVCHHCDNPSCCNPEHLFLGTTFDNVSDKVRKGRQAKGDRHGSKLHPERFPRGDRHYLRMHPERIARGEGRWNAKLTNSNVLAIRSDQRPQCVIANDYGVDKTVISKIKLRKIWAHI